MVGRPRHRGRLPPDVLQGGPGHPRRVPVRGQEGRGQGRRAVHPGRPAGLRGSLTSAFNAFYTTTGKNFWRHAPSDPTPYLLFGGNNTYLRPGISYIALRAILGPDRFSQALARIQQQYGGGSITEGQLEAGFAHWLPNPSAACQARLTTFFRQWWDTAYPPGGGRHRPLITGPGLAGPNFYGAGGCTR